MGKSITILGIAGFAGSGLAKRLLAAGHTVTGIDIVSPHMAWALRDVIDHPKLTYLWKGICDVTHADLADQDYIIHLAAQADVPMGITSPRWTVMENVDNIIHLLDLAKDCPKLQKFVYAGSGNEFGVPQYLPIDEKHPLTPANPYAFSKAAAEMACFTYRRAYNVPVVVMSNGSCLGAGMRRDIFVFLWLRNIRKGLPVRLEGGIQTRDLTYVSDILDAWDLVIGADPSVVVGEKFQVSYGEEVSVADILEMCFEVTGKRVEVVKTDFRPGETNQREQFTNAKARRVLGYAPKVGPREGIQLTWDWLKALPESEL